MAEDVSETVLVSSLEVHETEANTVTFKIRINTVI